MADLKHTIDERIRKLTMLRELADDPETKQLLMGLVSVGNGSSKQDAPEKKRRASRGHQKTMVNEVLSLATNPVTTDQIVEGMIKRGFQFKSAKPAIAVNEALNSLKNDGLAKIARSEGTRNFWLPDNKSSV